MKRIYIKDNYLIISNNSDITDDKRNPKSNVYVEKNGNLFIFYKLSNDEIIDSILYSNILDKTGIAYTDIATFTDLMDKNTGEITSSSSSDLFLEIPKGNVNGVTSVNKFGENHNSDIGIKEEVWEGSVVYTYPTTADITHIKTLVSDIPLQGAIIKVEGLDINYNEVTQNVTLATPTTTAVALTTPLLRIYRMEVMSSVVNQQIIYAYNAAATIEYARIDIAHGQTLMALYTVPAGKTAYITKYYGDVVENVLTGKDPDVTEFELWTADIGNNYQFNIKHERAVPKGASGFSHDFKPYLKVNEKHDIKMTTVCSGKAGHVHSGFDLILIDN